MKEIKLGWGDYIGILIVFTVGVFLWEDFFGFSIIVSIILSLVVLLTGCLFFSKTKFGRFAFEESRKDMEE